MERSSRLRRNEDFQRVRREGRSFAAPWLVLMVARNELATTRYGFAVGKRIGKAVVRNRVKRRLREVLRLRRDTVAAGWDVVLIARDPLTHVTFEQLDQAVAQLLRRAHLLRAENEEPRHETSRSGPD